MREQKKKKSCFASQVKWFIKQRKLLSVMRELSGLFVVIMAFRILEVVDLVLAHLVLNQGLEWRSKHYCIFGSQLVPQLWVNWTKLKRSKSCLCICGKAYSCQTLAHRLSKLWLQVVFLVTFTHSGRLLDLKCWKHPGSCLGVRFYLVHAVLGGCGKLLSWYRLP